MQQDVVVESEVSALSVRRPAWSAFRKRISALVLVFVFTAAGLFTWRASLSPLELWSGGSQCSATPGVNAGQLFGLALSSDLDGASQITILDVDTLQSTGAAAPTYWIVPVTDGSGGTGVLSTEAPPPHWKQRVPAKSVVFSASTPANLVAELHPRLGRASLTGVRVTYRTTDGFIHTATIDPRNFVDTDGKCASS